MKCQVRVLMRCALPVSVLLALPSCSQLVATNDQAVVANAMDADQTITDADNDRADHLDEKAEELRSAANITDLKSATSLRREAENDTETAAQIRQQGYDQGASAEDNIDQSAGLFNTES